MFSSGEIVRLDGAPVPEPMAIHSSYLFYVHSQRDAPGPKLWGEASVTFADLAVVGAQARDVRIGIAPWAKVRKTSSAGPICTGPTASPPPSTGALLHSAATGEGSRQEIPATGVYALFLANCGNASDARLSVSVGVKNPYGFIPGNEYGSLWVYSSLLLGYALVLVVWTARLLLHIGSLRFPHHVLTAAICVGICEMAIRSVQLRVVNTVGVWKDNAMSDMLCVLKASYVLGFFAIVAEGVGVATTQVSCCTLVGAIVVMIAYALAGSFKASAFSMRHRVAGADGVVGSLVPLVLVCLVVAVIVLRRLAGVLRRCREQGQDAVVRMLQRMAFVIVVLSVSAASVLAAQVADEPGWPAEWWWYHVATSDLAPQALFLAGLATALCIWRPGAEWAEGLAGHDVETAGLKVAADQDCEDLQATPIGMPAE